VQCLRPGLGSSEEAFRQAFEIDLMHTRNACEAAIPLLERSGEGAIVAISSISGSEDYGYGSSAYGTMKAALFFYVKSLARHVARAASGPTSCRPAPPISKAASGTG
jgi:3-oxoacyl-[acyl-carrier protein] reductase